MVQLIKYPRTFHFPWSPGVGRDDRVHSSVSQFEGLEVVATVKMDGENWSIYNDYSHARSTSYSRHESRTWIRGLAGSIQVNIPLGWRLSVECLYAKHSIYYTNLESYGYGIGVWNENNMLLSWDECLEWFELLGITPVPTLYRGPWDEEKLKSLWTPTYDGDEMEGFVVRNIKAFSGDDFSKNVGKYVRKGHVTTSQFWLNEPIVPNILKEKAQK